MRSNRHFAGAPPGSMPAKRGRAGRYETGSRVLNVNTEWMSLCASALEIVLGSDRSARIKDWGRKYGDQRTMVSVVGSRLAERL